MKYTDLQKLSLDVYKGKVSKFSVDEGNDAIRNAINDACGGEFNYYSFLDNRGKVYSIISEVLSISLGDLLLEQFSNFAEVHDIQLGDKKEFTVNEDGLFRVATIAQGTQDLRRQTIFNRKIEIATAKLGIKIYTDMDLFVSGRINWTNMVERVSRSYAHEIGKRTYEAIYDAYDLLSAPYAISGSWSATELATGIGHVEAQTGLKASVYGTKIALGKIVEATVSEKMIENVTEMGHYGKFRGTNLIELPQMHTVGTDTFAINDSFLLILPEGESFVKIVLEGLATVYESNGEGKLDEQLELYFGRKVGVGVLIARNFAIFRLS